MMQAPNEKPTAEQIKVIFNNLLKRSSEPVGEHLTDEQFTDYVLNSCSSEEEQMLDQHLDRCQSCLKHLEFLYESDPFWNSKEAQQMQAAFFDTASTKSKQKPAQKPALSALKKFSEAIATLLPPPSLVIAGGCAKSSPERKLDSLDYNGDILMFSMENGENGLVLCFSTKILNRGNKLTLSNHHEFSRDIKMERLGNELSAELILTAEEQEQIQAALNRGEYIYPIWTDDNHD
jgi:hypothetical protein